MRQTLRNEFESVPPQTDTPQRRLQASEEVSPLYESLRVHAGPVYAHPDPRTETQVHGLQQSFLATLAPSRSHEVTHGRQTIWVCPLRKGICGPVQLTSAHADAFLLQTLRVQTVQQKFRSQVLLEQALRVSLLQGILVDLDPLSCL